MNNIDEGRASKVNCQYGGWRNRPAMLEEGQHTEHSRCNQGEHLRRQKRDVGRTNDRRSSVDQLQGEDSE